MLALLLTGLIVSHLVGLWLLSDDASRIHPRSSLATGDLFARVYRSVSDLPPPQARPLVEAMSDAKMRFDLVAAPTLAASTVTASTVTASTVVASTVTASTRTAPAPTATIPATAGAGEAGQAAGGEAAEGDTLTAARTLALVTRLLDLDRAGLRVCAGATCPASATAHFPADGVQRISGQPLAPILIEARLADDRWLTVTAWSELRQRWWWPISFWLQASLVPIFIAVAIVMHLMLRPWRKLVTAANRASRGERIEALPVTGPREMREVLLAFNQMQRRITRFLDDRTRMLAALSHDFRRPLTSLRLWADLVDDDSLRQPMIRTLGEMRAMVDETLALMRDEVALEDTVEVSLRDLLEQLIDEHSALGLDVAWEAAPATACPYRCRPIALKRAFANVLDNAIRYGGGARVELKRHQPDSGPDLIEVTIDDTGPGLTAERLASLFEAGAGTDAGAAPASPASTARPGLGLPIARMFARAHGGELTLQPRPRQRGLRAIFLLPAA